MTSKVNADNTLGGVILTGDSSGILELQAGGNTGITLNNARAVGVGATPSFGTSGQVLTSAGSSAAPTWTVPSITTVTGVLPIANGGTNTTAVPTAGAIAYGTGTAVAYTGVGTAGQALLSTGTGTPIWGRGGLSAGRVFFTANLK
jgi:hypothetical protein